MAAPVSPVEEPQSNDAAEASSGSTGLGAAGMSSEPKSMGTTMNTPLSGSGLGGLEGKGAHETGRFPVVRHDTDMSVSALHVPGEFPRRA